MVQVTAPSTGAWVHLRGARPWVVTVSGPAGIQWRLLATNSPSRPTDNDHPAISGDVTGPGIITQDIPYEWLNVVPLNAGGGTLSADLYAG